MLKNHFVIAWRNLWKNKKYNILNIFGLAIGITCTSLILLWVEDEMGYNKVFPKQDTIYYLPTNQEYEGEWRTFFQSTPGPLANDLKNEIPEIVRAARTLGSNFLFANGDKNMYRFGRYADTDILEIFDLEFLEGSTENALDRPDALIITQKLAHELFGEDEGALNKTIMVNNAELLTITGVIKDLPENVSFGFNWLTPIKPYLSDEARSWANEYGNNFADTFVELSPEADFENTDAKVRAFLPSKIEGSNDYAFLHNIKDWHLRSNFIDGKKKGGRIVLVRLMAIVALLILLIACINFMNLSTARSEKRGKEVGVRKVLGSKKNSLVSQFMTEAVMTSALAGLLSVFLLISLMPHYNQLIGKQLGIALFSSYHGPVLLGVTLVCGILAGWYPALYLSSFRPAQVLKGERKVSGTATLIRKGLVVFQFAISIIFISATIVIYQQIQHIKNRNIGYSKENLLQVRATGNIIKNFDVIKNELIATGTTKNVALSNTNMLFDGNNGSGLKWQGGTDTEDVLISFRFVSADFFETFGLEIVDGRGFGQEVSLDSTNTLITESFAKMMGKGSAIGKTINRWEENYTVIGVVKDYVYGDMYGTSDPVMFFNNKTFASNLYIKLKDGTNLENTLTSVEKILKAHNPGFPVDYGFVDETFNALFRSEQLTGQLSSLFALLAILISCLGLFGLAAYTAEQRKKEIGVRKVLGSSTTSIVQLLSKDFMRLVFLALLIAGPLSWWMMKSWLENYAYRIEMNIWILFLTGISATCIALLTVGFQAMKAARLNPVKSLRTE